METLLVRRSSTVVAAAATARPMPSASKAVVSSETGVVNEPRRLSALAGDTDGGCAPGAASRLAA